MNERHRHSQSDKGHICRKKDCKTNDWNSENISHFVTYWWNNKNHKNNFPVLPGIPTKPLKVLKCISRSALYQITVNNFSVVYPAVKLAPESPGDCVRFWFGVPSCESKLPSPYGCGESILWWQVSVQTGCRQLYDHSLPPDITVAEYREQHLVVALILHIFRAASGPVQSISKTFAALHLKEKISNDQKLKARWTIVLKLEMLIFYILA